MNGLMPLKWMLGYMTQLLSPCLDYESINCIYVMLCDNAEYKEPRQYCKGICCESILLQGIKEYVLLYEVFTVYLFIMLQEVSDALLLKPAPTLEGTYPGHAVDVGWAYSDKETNGKQSSMQILGNSGKYVLVHVHAVKGKSPMIG